MAEIALADGVWTFDGETLRIVPGSGRDVHEIRKALGELVIPLEAIAGATFEPARKGGHLRLRLRKGADPLTDAVAGSLTAPADPYRLQIPKDRTGAAEYFADEIRDSLAVWQTAAGPCEDFVLPGPEVPITATAGDGTVSFDGERVRVEWTGFASTAKDEAGPQEFAVADLTGVEWKPQSGMGYGVLRFHPKDEGPLKPPQKDPRCLSWGVQRFGGTTCLVAAAVLARIPRGPAELPPPPSTTAETQTILGQLSELGELHRQGVLTDEEFSAAKQALLRRLG
ncbi:DUF4429 domain-containing protein [Nonomuraea sp. NPDC049486]|uniref:DUF4429 domain-containing protein n=1 Tax=Nonomuraea sp. NPDC049486 TaxID=3155773 RepID=UPI00341A6423